MALAPYFSKMYVENELESLQQLVTISARIILLVTVPVVFVFVLYGEQFLELVFGEEYAYGSTALAIMSIAQLFNASFGSVGLLLNMTGHEKQVAQGVAFAAVLNIVLNVLLIPLLGIEGAAIATAVTFFTWNVLLWRAVIKYVGVDTLAIPITRRLKAEIDKTDNLFSGNHLLFAQQPIDGRQHGYGFIGQGVSIHRQPPLGVVPHLDRGA